MKSSLAARLITAGPILLLVVGCAGSSEKNAGPAAGGEPAQAQPSTSRAVALTSENLTAYERGLRKEIEAVKAAQARSASATTPEERGEAIQASFESATLPQGAEAAGLPVDQYRAVRETVNGVFRTLDFQGKIDGPLSMDLSRADLATKERLARDPFTDLSPESAATLRAAMARLVPLWIEYTNLTAVAG